MRFRLPTYLQIADAFEQHPWVQATLNWTKTHSFPGFFGVPLYDVAVFLYNESKRVTLSSRANAMAFSFFLSLFPAIIFLFTVATYLPIYENFEQEINGYISLIMPNNAGKEIQATIKELVKPSSSFLSIGFFLAMYFSSNGMMAMMEGFEKTHVAVFQKRPGWKKRLIALGLTLQLGFLLAGSVVLLVLGDLIINWVTEFFNLDLGTERVIDIFRWVVILTLFYFSIALIYRYGAALRTRFKWVTPGASLATILSITTSVAFSFYVNSFGTYNKVYGSIGTIIVLMLWIQLNCLILQIGFELNASIAANRDLKMEIEEED
ncbi:MAG: YihY/virulence factor BrkB family protein [Saprospiraceae bacterium]|nr:YihY/virulence factor BrkB family protein [Saprospiraceae bacterium]MCF8250177.1 YihY/virulence factor BrkB family protein [Saprospiraceae bacterium]MCF8279440.1 YihY/virulence factor BrkB family protein [Bacteroidales bacterium]MCF8311231.1 YihY/virulence factor BrkB family protein [Saprospiraceae bacterium]MCF8440389.1 YihY/virulence factor BrkB family protein [Saprospiraceae bacterium]